MRSLHWYCAGLSTLAAGSSSTTACRRHFVAQRQRPGGEGPCNGTIERWAQRRATSATSSSSSMLGVRVDRSAIARGPRRHNGGYKTALAPPQPACRRLDNSAHSSRVSMTHSSVRHPRVRTNIMGNARIAVQTEASPSRCNAATTSGAARSATTRCGAAATSATVPCRQPAA